MMTVISKSESRKWNESVIKAGLYQILSYIVLVPIYLMLNNDNNDDDGACISSILFLLSNNAPTRARTLQPINCLMYLPNRKTIHMTKSHLHPRVCSLELTPARSVMHPANRKKKKPNKPETQETSSKTLYHKDNKKQKHQCQRVFPLFSLA
jgi:hypothetical protein